MLRAARGTRVPCGDPMGAARAGSGLENEGPIRGCGSERESRAGGLWMRPGRVPTWETRTPCGEAAAPNVAPRSYSGNTDHPPEVAAQAVRDSLTSEHERSGGELASARPSFADSTKGHRQCCGRRGCVTAPVASRAGMRPSRSRANHDGGREMGAWLLSVKTMNRHWQ